MKSFDEIVKRGHEQVNYFHDPLTNLKAIVAVHSTILGPSLGGCRMMEYESDEKALIDVLRLSKGMTYKAAISDLKLGGGKSVIIGNPKQDKSERLLEKFGEFVEGLNGRYITAEDMGTTVEDMAIIKNKTQYVTGTSESLGGSGDPSDFTSYGTYIGIKAAVLHKLKRNSLDGLSIFIQGVGNVGMKLISYLCKEDVKIYIDDKDEEKVEKCVSKFNAIDVKGQDYYNLNVDIYSPCAIGATINDKSISKLKCKIVAGAANNVLEDYKKHGDALFRKEILYAPDYVINAGGLINIYNELGTYDRKSVFNQVEKIHDTLMTVFSESDNMGVPTNIIADMLAEEKIKNKIAQSQFEQAKG